MLITSRFVVVNFGKTGTTFLRQVLKELHERTTREPSLLGRVLQKLGLARKPMFEELLLPNPEFTRQIRNQYYEVVDQHGAYCQIPPQYRDREVVAIARNPYTRFISNYTARHWVGHPLLDRELIARDFPNFPDLSIDEFVDLFESVTKYSPLGDRLMRADIGRQSIDFIKMFFKDPLRTYSSMDEGYTRSDRIFDDMGNVTFLRQESLVQDLIAFLRRHGYPERDLEFIKTYPRVNESRSEGDGDGTLLTPKVLEYVSRKDLLTFRIFESKGIRYQSPTREPASVRAQRAQAI